LVITIISVVILLLFGGFVIGNVILPTVIDLFKGGETVYDEGVAAEYTSQKYETVFSDDDEPEKNILIVSVLDRRNNPVGRYTRIGKELTPDIQNYLATGDKEKRIKGLESLSNRYVNEVEVINSLKLGIGDYSNGLGDSGDTVLSRIINETALELSAQDEDELDRALKNFARKTGISIAFVYVYEDQVFSRQVDPWDIVGSIVCIAVIVAAAIFIVKRGAGRNCAVRVKSPVDSTEDAPVNIRSNEYTVKGYTVKASEDNSSKNTVRDKKRNNAKDDRYRRGYDKSRYKKK
jgi:hypothetical protein